MTCIKAFGTVQYTEWGCTTHNYIRELAPKPLAIAVAMYAMTLRILMKVCDFIISKILRVRIKNIICKRDMNVIRMYYTF